MPSSAASNKVAMQPAVAKSGEMTGGTSIEVRG